MGLECYKESVWLSIRVHCAFRIAASLRLTTKGFLLLWEIFLLVPEIRPDIMLSTWPQHTFHPVGYLWNPYFPFYFASNFLNIQKLWILISTGEVIDQSTSNFSACFFSFAHFQKRPCNKNKFRSYHWLFTSYIKFQSELQLYV